MNTESSILQVPIEDIVPNRFQPRKVFDEAALQELADSIKEHGIIQPLVLRRNADKYEIIAGERRYRAAQKVGLMTVPAIIANLTDEQSAEVAIVENVQRRNLTAIEEAKSFKSILDKGYTTQEELARKLGVSQSAISNKLRLLSLDEEVQNAVIETKISERHARSLLKIADHAKQKELLQRVINERLTVKQLDTEIKKELEAVPKMNENTVSQNQVETIPNNFVEKPITQAEDLNGFLKNNVQKEEIPNKFFNYLEDYSANMNMPENNDNMVDIFNVNPQDTTSNYDAGSNEVGDTKFFNFSNENNAMDNNSPLVNDVVNENTVESGNKFFNTDLNNNEDTNIDTSNDILLNNSPFEFLPNNEYNNDINVPQNYNTNFVNNPSVNDEIEMLDDFFTEPVTNNVNNQSVPNFVNQGDPFANIKEFLSFDTKLVYREYTDERGKHLEISVKNN